MADDNPRPTVKLAVTVFVQFSVEQRDEFPRLTPDDGTMLRFIEWQRTTGTYPAAVLYSGPDSYAAIFPSQHRILIEAWLAENGVKATP